MQIENLSPDEIRPYEGNPRRIDKDVIESVANSIREFGFRQPIVVDPDRIVIVGHARLLAAQSLGLTSIPVHIATDMSAEQVRAYRLADNRLGELADWDVGGLQAELDGLINGTDFDMTDFGFGEMEIELAKVNEQDIMEGVEQETDELLFGMMSGLKPPTVSVNFLNEDDIEPFLNGLPENSSYRRMATGQKTYIVHIPARDQWPEHSEERQFLDDDDEEGEGEEVQEE